LADHGNSNVEDEPIKGQDTDGSEKLASKENNSDSHRLNERLKELNCLYGISIILENDTVPLDEALQKVVEMIPKAWQYPDISRARITIGEKTFQSEGFLKSKWTQEEHIKLDRDENGKLEIVYIQKMPEEDEGPFLSEERSLIKDLAGRLGKFISLRMAQEELRQFRETLEKQSTEISQRMNTISNGRSDWQVIVDFIFNTDPQLLLRMTRKMMQHLHRSRKENVEKLLSDLSRKRDVEDMEMDMCWINMPNPRCTPEHIKNVQEGVFDLASKTLPPEEISDLLRLWIRQDKARPLLLAAKSPSCSLVEITDRLNQYQKMLKDDLVLAREDELYIRSAMIRRFFTDRPEFIQIAKEYVQISDFVDLVKRVIGPAQGTGKLGGKAAGVFLAEKILKRDGRGGKRKERFEEISFPHTWYVTTDTMNEFLRYNALEEAHHIKYRDPDDIKHEQPFLLQVFKNAEFPSEIVEGFKKVLMAVGDRPIIVRSSTLLEDSLGAAFSGKYKSLFLANSGDLEDRLRHLQDAISEVYASMFGPDPIGYRRERGLLDVREEMGIMIQEVVGSKVGPYFFPSFAGVAFSNNEFRWSPRIRREDGVVRMVAGLGTRAVDRVVDDYPVLISPNRPDIRVNTMIDETVQYSQREMDVINRELGKVESVPLKMLFKNWGNDYPFLNRVVSIYRDGALISPTGMILDPSGEDLVVTFAGVVERTPFIKLMNNILRTLKDALKTPVDVEFAQDGKDLFFLQCRPQSQAEAVVRVPIPSNIPKKRQVFSADRYVNTGVVENVEHLIYVDPKGYESLPGREDMLRVASAIGEINGTLPKRKFIMIGPGRWGSRGDIKLGVPVTYSDINNTALLVEFARKRKGYVPELSFGTHFFQDLVEAGIHYLPLYPDNPGTVFNESVFLGLPNRLMEVVPKYKDLENVIKLARCDDFGSGFTLRVVMDGDTDNALGYLEPPGHWYWRLMKAEELAKKLDPEAFGVTALYVFGSTKNGTAGPRSDIDLLVHFTGSETQRDRLLGWFQERDRELVAELEKKTGENVDGLLDVHFVNDVEIKNRSSWAVHVDSPTDGAKKLTLGSREKLE